MRAVRELSFLKPKWATVELNPSRSTLAVGLAKLVCGSTRLRPGTRLSYTQTRPVYVNGSGLQTRHDTTISQVTRHDP
jgi:hypothetical protein